MSGGRGPYPPGGHIIRQLAMELELRSTDELVASMPVGDDLRDGGGGLRLGALAVLVDVVAGTLSHEQVRPDWLATTDMTLHLRRPALGDRVTTVTNTVRAGGRNVVSSTVASDDEGEVARAWVTYVRLPRRDDSPELVGATRIGRTLRYVEDDEVAAATGRPPLDEYLGLRILPDELAIEADHGPRLHNSFGSLQGGAAAVMVERLTTLAAELRFGQPARATDLHIQYLGQTRAGPFRVEGQVLRADPGAVVCETHVLDAGNDRHLLDLATATAAPIDPA